MASTRTLCHQAARRRHWATTRPILSAREHRCRLPTPCKSTFRVRRRRCGKVARVRAPYPDRIHKRTPPDGWQDTFCGRWRQTGRGSFRSWTRQPRRPPRRPFSIAPKPACLGPSRTRIDCPDTEEPMQTSSGIVRWYSRIRHDMTNNHKLVCEVLTWSRRRGPGGYCATQKVRKNRRLGSWTALQGHPSISTVPSSLRIWKRCSPYCG
jgi:hypothetical protein